MSTPDYPVGGPVPPVIRAEKPVDNTFGQAVTLWVVIGLFFGLLIGASLADLKPTAKDKKQGSYAYASEVTTLESALGLSSLFPADSAATLMHDSIEKTRGSVRKKAETDADAALLMMITDSLENKEADPADLSLVKRRGKAVDRAAEKVFEGRIKTPDQARQLIESLEPFEGAEQLLAYTAYREAGLTDEAKALYPPGRWMGILFFFFLVGVCAIVGLAFWVDELTKKNPVLSSSPQFPTPTQVSGAHLGIGMVLLMLFFTAVSIANGVLARGSLSSPTLLITGSLFLAVLWFLLRGTRWQGSTLAGWLNRSDAPLRTQLLWGFKGYCMNLPVLAVVLIGFLVLRVTSQDVSHPISDEIQGGLNLVGVMVVMFAGTVLAPIWEEIGFRGFLLSGLVKFTGRPVLAALLSSFCFAAIHPQGPMLWLVLGWIGFLSCMMVMRTKSLIPSIVFHSLHNGTVLTLALLYTA